MGPLSRVTVNFLYLAICVIFVGEGPLFGQTSPDLSASQGSEGTTEPIDFVEKNVSTEPLETNTPQIEPAKAEPAEEIDFQTISQPVESTRRSFHWDVASRNLIFFGTGIEGGATWNSKLRASLGLYASPGFFASGFGSFSAKLAGKTEYKSIFSSVLSGQVVPMVGATYHLDRDEGFWIGASLGYSSASGEVTLGDLEASTGRSYTILKTALTRAGKPQEVTVSSSVIWAEVSGGYLWKIAPRWNVLAGAGVVKSIGASSTFSTQAAGFDVTPGGAALLESGQTDMDRILGQFGLSPTIALAVRYSFL
jgi:hypothetical protein